MMSGTTPKNSEPCRYPMRPKAVCASSKMSSMPRSFAARRNACMYDVGGTSTPPALMTGSMMMAARRPVEAMSNIFRPISRHASADSSPDKPWIYGR